jgi:hypothetical protein
MNPARHHPHRNRSAACIFVDIYKRLVRRSSSLSGCESATMATRPEYLSERSVPRTLILSTQCTDKAALIENILPNSGHKHATRIRHASRCRYAGSASPFTNIRIQAPRFGGAPPLRFELLRLTGRFGNWARRPRVSIPTFRTAPQTAPSRARDRRVSLGARGTTARHGARAGARCRC